MQWTLKYLFTCRKVAILTSFYYRVGWTSLWLLGEKRWHSSESSFLLLRFSAVRETYILLCFILSHVLNEWLIDASSNLDMVNYKSNMMNTSYNVFQNTDLYGQNERKYSTGIPHSGQNYQVKLWKFNVRLYSSSHVHIDKSNRNKRLPRERCCSQGATEPFGSQH